jgi:urea transport system substrate-binding protein
MMFSISEDDVRSMPPEDVTGNYVVAGYFPGSDRPSGQSFIRSFKTKYGTDRPASEQATAAYDAVRLWAEAVKEAGTANVATVRSTIDHQTLAGEEGVIAIDPGSRHAWRNLAVGRIRSDGLVETLWSTRGPTRPTPFPTTRSHSEWMKFLALVQREKATRRAATTSEPLKGATP